MSGSELSGSVPFALQARFPLTSTSFQSTCLDGCTSIKAGCDMPERRILVDFFVRTQGARWVSSTSWASAASPCAWLGVNCTGTVVRGLRLPSNNLIGTVPDSLSLLNLTCVRASRAVAPRG